MMSGQGNFGFDAARKEYVDLVEAGIVDPTKVVRPHWKMLSRRQPTAAAHRSDHDGNSEDEAKTPG